MRSNFNNKIQYPSSIKVTKYINGEEFESVVSYNSKKPAKQINQLSKKEKKRLNRKKKKLLKPTKKTKVFSTEKGFYKSKDWRILRVRVLEKHDASCMCCGRNRKDHGVVLHVDHIKPRSKFPHLELVFENLQILCDDCNIGKSNKYETDYRPTDKQTTEYPLMDALRIKRHKHV